jgi:hypothetical protein
LRHDPRGESLRDVGTGRSRAAAAVSGATLRVDGDQPRPRGSPLHSDLPPGDALGPPPHGLGAPVAAAIPGDHLLACVAPPAIGLDRELYVGVTQVEPGDHPHASIEELVLRLEAGQDRQQQESFRAAVALGDKRSESPAETLTRAQTSALALSNLAQSNSVRSTLVTSNPDGRRTTSSG